MLGAGAYVTWTLNLWGPMFNMANAASAQALEEGKKRLRDFLESSDTGRQALGMSEEYEMRSMKGSRQKATKSAAADDEDDEI